MKSFWDAPRPLRLFVLVGAVILIALNLRPGATSIGPLMEEVLSGLGMSTTAGGILAALPGFSFAAFGLVAVAFAQRVGMNLALAIGASLIAVGLLGRTIAPEQFSFLALTVLAFAGMAIGNVLVPAFIKRRFPETQAGMTTLYTTVLAVGTTVPALLAIPVAYRYEWRASLGLWGLTAVVAALAWFLVTFLIGSGTRGVGTGARIPMRLMLRSRKTVALGVFFGTQSMQAYIQFGWLAQIYRDGNLPADQAGIMATILAGFGIPMGLIMPMIVAKLKDLRIVVFIAGLLLVGGYLGLLYAPTTLPWVWASMLGISGGAFPMAIALITARTDNHVVTGAVSGFAQSVGYVLAGVGPFAVGFLKDSFGTWQVPLWILIGTVVIFVLSGFIAASPGSIDDELPPGTLESAGL